MKQTTGKRGRAEEWTREGVEDRAEEARRIQTALVRDASLHATRFW